MPAGALVDRWDRKRIMLVCTCCLMLCALLIVVCLVLQFPLAIMLGCLYVLSFLIGTSSVFYGLAEVVALTRVVPKSQIPLALTQNEITYSATTLLAPPLGNFLLTIGRALPFLADAISYIVLLISLLCIRTSFQEQRREATQGIAREILTGLQWLRTHPLVGFLAFFSGFLEVIVILNVLLISAIRLEAGFPQGIVGVILAGAGIGNLLGNALGTYLQPRLRFGWGLCAVSIVFVLAWPLYGLYTNPLWLGSIVAFLALIDSVAYLLTASYRLAVVPDAFQGRVSSLYRLILFGFASLGPATIGVVLQVYGIATAINIIWGALFCFSCVIILSPQIRRATFPQDENSTKNL
ncbi:MFS transporter [Ktedonobacter racemifer]|uniref:MFS transporter n=1 Tax=Ktedonobacter racemifer TaxID=363277 RepID=UPI0009FF732F|nr:MFS transporter [Ktedonobacter racemifer]